MGDPTRVLVHLPKAACDAVAVHTSVVKGLVSLQRPRGETPEAAEFDQELPTKLVETLKMSAEPPVVLRPWSRSFSS